MPESVTDADRPTTAFLDIARALAAVEVVLGHGRLVLPAPDAHGGDLGRTLYAGVSGLSTESVLVFFVLSGLVIHLKLARGAVEARAGFDLVGYVRKRALRIYPPLTAALLLTLGLDFLGRSHNAYYYAHFLADPGSTATAAETSFKAFVAIYVGLTGIVAGTPGSDNPLWSLAYEIVYYAAYVVLALAIVARPRMRLLVLAVAACVGGSFVARSALAGCTLHCRDVLPGQWILWLGGAGLAEAYARMSTFEQRPAWVQRLSRYGVVIAVLLATAAYLVPPAVRNSTVHDFAHLYLVGAAFAAVVLAALWPAGPWRLLLLRVRRLLLPVTAASYSLYVVHMPVLHLVRSGLFGGATRSPTASGWGFVALYGLLTAAATVVVYWVAERPITGGWQRSASSSGMRKI